MAVMRCAYLVNTVVLHVRVQLLIVEAVLLTEEQLLLVYVRMVTMMMALLQLA